MLRPRIHEGARPRVRCRAKRLSSFAIRHSACAISAHEMVFAKWAWYIAPRLRQYFTVHREISRGETRRVSSVKERITLIWQIARWHDFEHVSNYSAIPLTMSRPFARVRNTCSLLLDNWYINEQLLIWLFINFVWKMCETQAKPMLKIDIVSFTLRFNKDFQMQSFSFENVIWKSLYICLKRREKDCF